MRSVGAPLLPLLVTLAAAAQGLATDEAKWRPVASLNVGRMYTCGAEVGGSVYAVDGWSLPSSYLSSVERYDPATDMWTNVTATAGRRHEFGCAGLGGKLYAVGPGGGPAGGPNEVYDPATDQWTSSVPHTIKERHTYVVGTVAGRAYALSGYPGSGAEQEPTVEAYDPANNSWSFAAPLLTARAAHATATVAGRMYVIGGSVQNQTDDSQPPIPIASVEAYDPVANTWAEVASLPSPRQALTAVAFQGKMYAIGGSKTFVYGAMATVDVYDPETNVWSAGPALRTARMWHGAAAVPGGILVFGGEGATGSSALATAEMLELS